MGPQHTLVQFLIFQCLLYSFVSVASLSEPEVQLHLVFGKHIRRSRSTIILGRCSGYQFRREIPSSQSCLFSFQDQQHHLVTPNQLPTDLSALSPTQRTLLRLSQVRFVCLCLPTPFLLEGRLLEGLAWWRLRALSHSHRPLSWAGTILIISQAKKHHRAVCQTPFGSVRIFSAFLGTSHSFHLQKKTVQGKKIILP